MPKSRKYSYNRRHMRHNRTKRGGMNTAELDAMEKGERYGIDISTPYLYDTKKVETKYNNKLNGSDYDPSKKYDVDAILRERENASKEFDKLTSLYEEEQKKQQDLSKVQQALSTPITSTEAANFFAENSKNSLDDCPDGTEMCQIMGGLKTRRNKKRSRKSRKHRRSRRCRK